MKLDFPGVELARDDQEEKTGELLPSLLEPAQVFGGDVGAEALQRGRQPLAAAPAPGRGAPAPASTGCPFRASSLPIT